MRRMLVGMSQEKLGDSLGLTFQQVQKYEKGANRIGASRLYQIARVLSVPVDFFYDGIQLDDAAGVDGLADAEPANFELDMLSTSEGIQLNSAFFSIRDPKVRKKVLELIKALGETGNFEGVGEDMALEDEDNL
ncbi:MAG TPA: helix-turn-helix domain-containing protein [Parvibaculum sp.]